MTTPDYSTSTMHKKAFTNNVFKKFTDLVGGDPEEFANELYRKFTVEDFGFHDDMVYWRVLEYFEKTVVPHKVEVYKAGMSLLSQPWISDFIKPYEIEQFKKNLWLHDLSKFSANESFGYAMYNFKNPHPKSKEFFEKAWHHHKMNNQHHPEYWLNPNRSGGLEPIRMPNLYLLEMVADWIGAGVTYGNSLENWLPENLHKFLIHPASLYQLSGILRSIGISTYTEAEDVNFGEENMRLSVSKEWTKINKANQK